MNPTAVKFGYPATLLKEYGHWLVLLRPGQVTLGSLVLVCREDAKRFGEITPAASTELQRVVADCERVLKTAFAFEKINYLMFMMVDPEVHFHVIPRYSGPKEFEGVRFEDPFWPKPPDIFSANTVPDPVRARLAEKLRRLFELPASSGA